MMRALGYWLRRAGYPCILCALFVATSAAAQRPPPSATELVVGGNVANPLRLGVEDLKRLAVQHLEDVRQIRVGGAAASGSEQIRRYAGVLLRDVLTAAKPVEKERHELRQSIVVVTATDGYTAVFSWAEMCPAPFDAAGSGQAPSLPQDRNAVRYATLPAH